MKFLHIADLHLGKKLHECSLYEDQKYILEQILDIVRQEQPQGVLIAGDVYDKSLPPADAVQLFDKFLTSMAELQVPAFIISGNHDSAERLSFGNKLMDGSGIHFASAYTGVTQKQVLEDAYGPVNIYLLPFVKPVVVRRYAEEAVVEELTSYHEAVVHALSRLQINLAERNILVAHQFVTGAAKCDSEDISVGGVDNIGAEAFADFDYVALGHIHSPQHIKGHPELRYSGTPLKYSFSEAGQQKSVTIVECGPKGELNISTRDLHPLHDVRKLRGSYRELTLRDNYMGTNLQDYLQITLTDEEPIPQAMARLQTIYPNLLKLEYDNTRTRTDKALVLTEELKEKTPLQLFGEFYQQQNNQELSQEQTDIVAALIAKLKGEAE